MNAPADGRGGPARDSGSTQAPERRARFQRAQRTKRPKGTPMLIVLMIIVVLPSVLLADAWGAGAAGIIGGLTGMFSLVVFMGGPLGADLRVALVMGPLLIIAAAVPRLVAEASRPAAMALVVLLTFVAALLPVIGPRFANAGMGLGMTTMFGYGYAPMGGADHQQVIAAAVAGVVVALLLRILMGISDPSKPTRQQIADVLVADDPSAATATAFGTWLSDGRQRWLADALEGASRYRLALRTAKVARAAGADAAGAALQGRARELAEELKAKPARDKPGQGKPVTAAAPAAAPDAADPHLAEAASALDTVEQAIREHDTAAVHLDRDRRHQLGDAVLHPSARVRSIQLRHALRAALAVLLMLLITSGLEPGDPLVSTALLTTFSILQASWGDTVTKTRNKIIGVVSGSLAVAVILLVVPHSYLVAVAAVSLCLGLWYIVTRPALGAAFMVVVSVGFNAVNRDLDPVTLLLQYVGLTASAVVVGVVFGFVVIPGLRPAPLRRRIENATSATASALRASSHGTGASQPEEIALFRDATRAQDELVPDRDRLDERQLAELDDLRTGLRDMTTLAEATTLTPEELEQVLHALSPEDPAGEGAQDGTAAEESGAASSTLWDLAQRAGSAERYLLRTLPVTR
ncbi:FUSC family protein [Microbacterium jiangjiandongii]|uniref:FUSC family protein n=1 Tax=Microbacterium jiangjiandongii TaxID=3049071 RepID=UPI00214BDB7F|nr:FUSC family protein [Microbacterium sp. zg.Y843]MCR2817047.1 FUSC family protein [Microbacterium sp. zg.Y843]